MDCQSMAFVLQSRLFGGKLSRIRRRPEAESVLATRKPSSKKTDSKLNGGDLNPQSPIRSPSAIGPQRSTTAVATIHPPKSSPTAGASTSAHRTAHHRKR